MIPGNDIVICRDFENEALVRRVWSVVEDGILICTEESLQRSLEENKQPIVVRVPFEAAYKYDQRLLAQLLEASGEHANCAKPLVSLWQEAEPYHSQQFQEKEDSTRFYMDKEDIV